jgi:hypothetical protein
MDQMSRVMTSSNTPWAAENAAGAFDRVTAATQHELRGPFRGAFDSCDRIQREVADQVSGCWRSGRWSPDRMARACSDRASIWWE